MSKDSRKILTVSLMAEEEIREIPKLHKLGKIAKKLGLESSPNDDYEIATSGLMNIKHHLEIKNKLIAEFVNDLEHHYDYDYEEEEKMEKLIEKWQQRLEE